MVSFASKLRQVVAANFVEISRPDTLDSKGTPKPEETKPETPKAAPEVQEPPVAASLPIQAAAAETVTPPEADIASTAEEEKVQTEPVVSTAPETETELPTETEFPPAPEAIRHDPMTLVDHDGCIDFDRVFARAEVPAAASFTAEQALSMLRSMPSDLPLRVKRLTVKATLDAVGQTVGATPRDIVNDAEGKVATLESFIRQVSERAEELRSAEDMEIERLRSLIAEREAEKTAISQQESAVFGSCRTKIEDLDQVIAFFTIEESTNAVSSDASEESEEENADELPAYLQEDAVKRLLGLHGDSQEEDSVIMSSVAAEPDAVGARPGGSRTRR